MVSESKSPRPAFALAVVFLAAIGDVGAPQVDLDHDLRGDGRPTKLSGVFRNVFADAGATSIVAPADGSRPQRLADVPVTYHLRYVHTDVLGSPVVETNAIGEEITGTRTLYEPYGTPLTTPRDGAPSYTGHQYDIGTGLIYAQQRYYDPQLGVFMSPDPMAVDTTSAFNFNRYAYANNSPYKFTDPDGRYAEAVLEVASLSVGLASFVNNASSGNYWAASADAVGIAIDGIGLAVPLAPGVAGLGIQASRAADAARNSTIIYRRGDSVETATRLERKATEAEASNIEIGFYPVSTDGLKRAKNF